MERKKPSGIPHEWLNLSREYLHEHIGRRSFLDRARRFALSGVTMGAVLETMRDNGAWAQSGKQSHPASSKVLDQLRTAFTFQISVDVATLQHGLPVAGAALKSSATMPTRHQGQSTVADTTQPNTIIEQRGSTMISEAETVVQTAGLSAVAAEAGTILQTGGVDAEDKTAILPIGESKTGTPGQRPGK